MWEDDDDQEDDGGYDPEEERRKLESLPIYKKSLEILDLTQQLVDTFDDEDAAKIHRQIMIRWRQLYETDAVFKLAETHDSYVLQQLILEAEREGLVTTHSLSGEARQHGHPLINGPLGSRRFLFEANTTK